MPTHGATSCGVGCEQPPTDWATTSFGVAHLVLCTGVLLALTAPASGGESRPAVRLLCVLAHAVAAVMLLDSRLRVPMPRSAELAAFLVRLLGRPR